MDLRFLADINPRATPKNKRRIPPDLLLLLVYFLLAIFLTWPTITHISTHLPGDGGDDPAIAWNLWWVKYALLNSGQNPWQSDFIFYPIGINLAFYTLTMVNAVTALPFTLNLGVVAASNLHLLFTFVISGYGAFLLVRYILTTADSLAAFPLVGGGLGWASAAIAGGFFAFASNKLFYVALGQYNIASYHWIPFVILYVLRTRRYPRHLKNLWLAGLFFTLQVWTELTYASFLLIFIGLYGVWELACGMWDYRKLLVSSPLRLPASLFRPHLRAVLIMGLTFAIGLSPILAQMLPDIWAEGDFLLEGSGFADAFSADLLGFIIPTIHHPLLGNLITQTNIQAYDKGQHIYVGFVLLGLLLLALLTGHRRAEMRFWLAATLVFALLCLGPIITINSHSTGLPGPFSLLQNLPFIKGNRYPSRYSVMLFLSLSIIAAFSLIQIRYWVGRYFKISNSEPTTSPHLHGRRLRPTLRPAPVKAAPSQRSLMGNLLFILIPFLFLLEHLSIPLPQSDARVPAAYQRIAAAPGNFTVLDIPFAWRNGFRITGAPTTQFMFGQLYQAAHQKRLLQGNTSRNPEFKFQYFTNAPIINSLLALETGKILPSERWKADRAIASEMLAFFDIHYIVVRANDSNNPAVTPQATIPYIEQIFPVEKIHNEAAIKIYRVIPAELSLQSPLQVDTASLLAPLYFGEGWGLLRPGQAVAAQRKEVRLLLPMTDQAQRLALRLEMPELYQAAPQSLFIELNGWQSPAQRLNPQGQELSFDLPTGIARPGLNDVWLHFAEAFMLPPPGVRALSRPPEITVVSAGEEVGDFGHIFVNGLDISPNQRGYNLAIIQPDGSFHTANFDTHLDPAASAALARFVASAPADAFIAVAAADEASANLSQAAVLALQSIGAAGDLRGCFRCSHAFIRTASGETFEALEALRPVGVTSGLGLTESTVAARLTWIKIEVVEP